MDFSLPFGEKGYTVSEQDEYLEVCIRLASTGSHEELLSSVEVNVSYEDQSATGMIHQFSLIESSTMHCMLSGGEDYCTSIDRILFTNGSVRNDSHCFNITIAEDSLAEGLVTFFI